MIISETTGSQTCLQTFEHQCTISPQAKVVCSSHSEEKDIYYLVPELVLPRQGDIKSKTKILYSYLHLTILCNWSILIIMDTSVKNHTQGALNFQLSGTM
jgi:hypothetical protein